MDDLTRRDLVKVAAAGAAGAIVAKQETAMAQEPKQLFGRSTRFCVVRHDTLAAFNLRDDRTVVEAQKQVDEHMLDALEEMVKAARAGRLEGRAALGLACAAW